MKKKSRIVIVDSSSEDEDDVPPVTRKPIICDMDELEDSDDGVEIRLSIAGLSLNNDSDDDDKPVGYFAALTNNDSSEKENLSISSSGAGEQQQHGIEAPWAYNSRGDYYYFQDTTMPPIQIPSNIFHKLYPHQKTGIAWMGGLHGGLLGDDMGMGKTFTTLTFLSALQQAETISNALIVAPLSVLRSWEREASHILQSRVQIHVVSGSSAKGNRTRILQRALRCTSKNPNLVITTYGLIETATQEFIASGKDYYWNYVVLDEGHTIKNHDTKTNKGCHLVCQHPETRRFMLTGTPLMNKLEELWTLFDWVTSRKVLSSLRNFRVKYARPIEAARDKFASQGVIQLGHRTNKELQDLLAPYFLQRLKIDYLKDKLPQKTEVVVWCHLSLLQRKLYANFLNDGNSLLKSNAGEAGALEAITWLKNLCGHPTLVQKDGIASVQQALNDSAKLQILADLVTSLSSHGHKTLVFSQKTEMLNIIEHVLQFENISWLRIDGKTKEQDRQDRVDQFNNQKSRHKVMLLSTKAAGVGLTLIGADRVVVFDPSWNPAEDSQAVDRCYRIGQQRPVVVFRLITAGTVEEKMYDKQIHKDGLRQTLFSAGTAERYFERGELSQLLQLEEPGVCRTMEKIAQHEMDWSPFEYLFSHQKIVGLSRHDIFYADSSAQFENPTTANTSPIVLGRAKSVLQQQPQAATEEFIPLGRKKHASNSRSFRQKSLNSFLQPSSPKSMKENGLPRRALKTLVDDLDRRNGNVDESFHRQISELVGSLGLFDEREG